MEFRKIHEPFCIESDQGRWVSITDCCSHKSTVCVAVREAKVVSMLATEVHEGVEVQLHTHTHTHIINLGTRWWSTYRLGFITTRQGPTDMAPEQI